MQRIKTKILYIKIPILGFLLAALVAGCHSKDPSPDSVNSTFLTSGTWLINRVTFNDVDHGSDFIGFTLSFQKTAFSSQNGDPVWPSSGTWKFSNRKATSLVRDDNLEIEILTISNTELKLSLQWSKTTYDHNGRVSSIAGKYVFEFSK